MAFMKQQWTSGHTSVSSPNKHRSYTVFVLEYVANKVLVWERVTGVGNAVTLIFLLMKLTCLDASAYILIQ